MIICFNLIYKHVWSVFPSFDANFVGKISRILIIPHLRLQGGFFFNNVILLAGSERYLRMVPFSSCQGHWRGRDNLPCQCMWRGGAAMLAIEVVAVLTRRVSVVPHALARQGLLRHPVWRGRGGFQTARKPPLSLSSLSSSNLTRELSALFS